MDEQRSSTSHRTRLRKRPAPADIGFMPTATALTFRMATLARELHQQHSPLAVMEHALTAAVALVPGAEHGAVSLVRARRSLTTTAATSNLVRGVDALQNQVRQGPGLDAAFDQRTCRVDDLTAETTRWPALAARAPQVGVASVLCLPLFIHDDHLGVLSLCSTAAAAFDQEAEHVGLVLAAHTAVAFASAQRLENTTRGLAHRDVIGQAIGILIERHQLNAQQAFEVLARYSQETNRKLHKIASEVVTATRVPGS